MRPRKGGRSPPWRKEGVTKSTRKPEGNRGILIDPHASMGSRGWRLGATGRRGSRAARAIWGRSTTTRRPRRRSTPVTSRGAASSTARRLNPVGPDGRDSQGTGDAALLSGACITAAHRRRHPRPPAGGAQTPRQQAAAARTGPAKARKDGRAWESVFGRRRGDGEEAAELPLPG